MTVDTVFVRLENVVKKYPGITALDGISFDVPQGKIFGYIGPNGAGKTTTIKILVGLIRNFEGTYLMKGKTVRSEFGEVQKILGYLPQGVSFQAWRTVDSALTTFGKLSGLDDALLEQQIVTLLPRLNLADVRYKKVSQLSGGMIQKLGLAQALLNTPEFLVLDEPLNGLDPTSRHEVKNIIKELSAGGTTIFFSSHILSDVEDIADEIAILDKGRILNVGNTAELIAGFSPEYTIELVLFNEIDAPGVLGCVPGIDRIDCLSPRKYFLHLNQQVDLEKANHEILTLLMAQKAHIRTFRRIEPNLDDVYLKYIQGA